ncbi:MAG TPA: DUF177 domain-containing protein [Thermoanaerobaculia bacterium]|nr:DUF177 domain-containing protein [Thermoanaerobaculia bacterium]
MKDAIVFDDIDQHGPRNLSGTFEIPAAEVLRHEVAGLGSVTIDVRADKGSLPGEYIVDGSSRFTADLTCSRCVEPYPFANVSSFHVRFRPRPEGIEENEEIEISAQEELDVEFYSERTVPLRDLALEQIQLSIPMKPLCDESCLGLCPVCGANRTRESCECEASMVDDRWGALKGIREELNKKKNV